MKFRVDFKVATLTFKVLESGEPGYLLENRHCYLSSNASFIGRYSKTFCDSNKDQDRRTSFSTLGNAGLEQSTTGHSQRIIRTIVAVKIKNSLLQTGLQLTEFDLIAPPIQLHADIAHGACCAV